MAGREFQKHFGMAENGQLNAGEWLAKCYRTLGLTARRWFMTRWSTDGPRSRPRRHVAGRDRSGRGLSRRFWECWNMLAAGLPSCAWWLTRAEFHRWATSGNVKLLLPPRQSRGTSLGGLDGRSTPMARDRSRLPYPW